MPKSVVLKCIDDDRVILEGPLDTPFTPDRDVVMNNMKCVLGRHKVIIRLKE